MQSSTFQFILRVWEEIMPRKAHQPEYTTEHARGGVRAELPDIETWENQYRGYEITITIPEYTCICPRTGLPDFGTITIHYLPDKLCLELKSLKYYIQAFRNIGIFNENAVNRILDDVVRACKPKWAVVKGEFAARGGMHTLVEARHPRKK
jgi:7-cyano-7-deazaguanine reductase